MPGGTVARLIGSFSGRSASNTFLMGLGFFSGGPSPLTSTSVRVCPEVDPILLADRPAPEAAEDCGGLRREKLLWIALLAEALDLFKKACGLGFGGLAAFRLPLALLLHSQERLPHLDESLLRLHERLPRPDEPLLRIEALDSFAASLDRMPFGRDDTR